jgi:hypothetical protein
MSQEMSQVKLWFLGAAWLLVCAVVLCIAWAAILNLLHVS